MVFLNIILKLSTNLCVGRVPVHRDTDEQVKIRSNDDGFFFDIRGIVHIEWIPEGRTVNQVLRTASVCA